jgi:hypothetical protein
MRRLLNGAMTPNRQMEGFRQKFTDRKKCGAPSTSLPRIFNA